MGSHSLMERAAERRWTGAPSLSLSGFLSVFLSSEMQHPEDEVHETKSVGETHCTALALTGHIPREQGLFSRAGVRRDKTLVAHITT